ncbi:MAG: GAF domain-containing protein, partial [Candidatus Sericytochromatia bacterium]
AHFTLDPADALLRRALAVEGHDEAALLSLERLQANVWRHQGKGKEALECYTEGRLLERLEAAGDPSLAEETTSYGALLSVVGRYDEAREVLGRAIALTDDGADPATAVRARIYAGRAAYFSGDAASAKATLKEAVAIGRAAREAGKPAMLAVALSFYGYFLASGGAVEEGLEALAEAVEAAGTADHPVQANEAQSMRGNVLMAGGRPREAKEAFEAILATCARFDLPYDELMARLNLSAAWLALGNAHEARAHAERVAEASRAGGRRFPEAFARAVAGRARIQLGELALGEQELKAGLAIAQEIGNRYLELNVLVPFVDALNALGRPEAAIEAIAKARELASSLNSHEHDATLDRYEAEAALQQALAPDAGILALTLVGERLSGYASRMRASGRKSDLAHALQLQASWSQRCGDMAPGRAWVDEALVIAEAAGLERLVARLDFTRAKLAATAALQASAVAGLQSVAVSGFARAGDRAKALGDVMLDLISTAGALQVQNLNRETQAIAKQLEALTEGLDRAEADRYLHQPDLVEITRSLPAAGMSPAARDVLGLVASFDDSGDLPALLKRAVSTMVGFAGAERGFLLLFEDMDTTHKVVHGIYDDDDMTFSASLAYQVLWSEESLFVEDAQADGQFAGQASVRALDLRSVVGVPLLVNGGAIGVMIADSQEVTASFSDFHLELLEALARRVSGAIGNARLRQEEARRAATSDMLERLALATVGCVDLEEFMAPVAAEALTLTGADRLCLLVGEALTCRVAFDRDGRSLPVAEQAPSLSASRWVYEHDEPLYLHDALTSETFSAQRSVMALGLRTIHAVPVTHAQRVLGVLYLDDRRVGIEDPHVTAALRKLGAMVGALLTRRGLIE